MRFIVTNFGPTYPLGIGGGALSNIDLEKLLLELNYKVLNLGFFEKESLSEYEIEFRKARKRGLVKGSIENYVYLNKIISINKPWEDYLIELAKASTEKENYLILRPYGFKSTDDIGSWSGRILFWNNDFDINRAKEGVKIIKKQGGKVAAISKMLVSLMHKKYKIKADVLKSVIDLTNIKKSTVKSSILNKKNPVIGLPNPNFFKFGNLPFKIIERLRKYQFLAVTTWGWSSEFSQKLKLNRNIKVLSNLIDVSLFYKNIDILLVPTVLPESYPRFIQEALFLRVPIVASAIGNLPEFIGDCGILVNSKKIDHWRIAVESAKKITMVSLERGRKRVIEFQKRARADMKDYFTTLQA